MLTSKYDAAYENASGPGDARPDAMQVLTDEGLVGKLHGVVFMVTGGSNGYGLETVRALHAAGATVLMPVRSRERGENAVMDIQKSNGDSPDVGEMHLLDMDLASLESVHKCAKEVLTKHQKLNVLVNNAGVMATPEGTTAEGFETQFGVNHLGPFLLFQLLKPLLLSSSTSQRTSRVVNVSSNGTRFTPVLFDDLNLTKMGYSPLLAYGQSKTANIWMATEIERRYGSKGLHATSLTPGISLATGLKDGYSPEATEMMAAHIGDPALQRVNKTPAQGAATIVWAAAGKEWEGQGGKYLENLQVSTELPEGVPLSTMDVGYAPHAFDAEGEKRLWEVSSKLVGVEE